MTIATVSNPIQQYFSTLLNGGVDSYQDIYNTNARFISVVLAAGASYDIQEGHTFFRVESGLNVFVNFNLKKPDVSYPAGTGYSYPDYAPVRQLRVTNGDAGAQTITFYYGTGSFLDTRVTLSGSIAVTSTTAAPVYVSNASTTIVTAADVAVAATTTTQIVAANAANRTVIISNLAANGTVIRVGDASTGAARGIEVPAGGSASLDTKDAVYVYNPKASGINIGNLQFRN